MALTSKSLADLANRRAARARKDVEAAEAELKHAHESLDAPADPADAEHIQDAKAMTRRAEAHLVSAKDELAVVGQLLSENAATSDQPASGEGLRSLVEKLKGSKKDEAA